MSKTSIFKIIIIFLVLTVVSTSFHLYGKWQIDQRFSKSSPELYKIYKLFDDLVDEKENWEKESQYKINQIVSRLNEEEEKKFDKELELLIDKLSKKQSIVIEKALRFKKDLENTNIENITDENEKELEIYRELYNESKDFLFFEMKEFKKLEKRYN